MKKEIFILLLLTLLLTSCAAVSKFIPSFASKEEAGRGLILSWEEYPQAEYLDEAEPFRLVARIENNLNYPIQGQVCLHQTAPQRIGGIPSGSCRTINIPAAEQIDNKIFEQSDHYVFPETGNYEYRGLSQDLPHETKFIAELDYIVDAKAGTTLCVKQPGIPENRVNNCEDKQTITDIQQPEMPIEIDKVEKSLTAQSDNQLRLNLNVYVELRDTKGLPFSPDALSSNMNIFERPFIQFEARYGNVPLLCQGVQEGRIRFDKSEKVIKCFGTVLVDAETLQDVLELHLVYGYRTSIETPIIKLRRSEVSGALI